MNSGDVLFELLVKVTGPAELEKSSNGMSMLGVLLLTSSGDVARDDCPERNTEVASVALPLDGDGDVCCPLVCPF